MRAARAALLGLLALVLLYPLARLLLMPLVSMPLVSMPLVSIPLGTAADAAAGWRPWLNSTLFALLTGLIVAPMGAAIAHALETRSGLAARALGLGLWGLFLLPGYVLTTGWLVVFSRPLLRNGLFGHLFLGEAGLAFLYVLKALPFAVFVARSTFASASASLREAALVLRLPGWRRMALSLRLVLPAMAAAFAIGAIETMQDFGIPATLGVTARIPILTYSIYRRLDTTPTDFTGAALLCWWLVASAALLTLLQCAVQRRWRAALVHGKARGQVRRPPAGGERLGLAVAALLLWGLGLAMPLLALAGVALAGAGEGGALHAVPRSLGYGVLAASLALCVSAALLRLQHGRHPLFRGVIHAGLTANMAVPGLVLGAGYVVAFNNDVLPLYGTALLLVIAYAAGALPMAIRLLDGAMAQRDERLDEAARIFALSWPTRLIDIEAASLIRPALHAWLLVVGAVMFELPVSELLYVPGQMPLGVAIVSADMMGRYGAAARLALLAMGVLAMLAVGLTWAVRLSGHGALRSGRRDELLP
ncbi:ABC transporter permease [Acidocella sp.]|uniref:ABC transporter permease n=1 Tax=Acidocella sp. TaxID=50710 RepID=UPI003D03C1EF